MVACTLAFDLDRENAQDYVPRLPMYKSVLDLTPLWSQSPSRVENPIQDFVAFVTVESHGLLNFGSLYLRCVRRVRESTYTSSDLSSQRSHLELDIC